MSKKFILEQTFHVSSNEKDAYVRKNVPKKLNFSYNHIISHIPFGSSCYKISSSDFPCCGISTFCSCRNKNSSSKDLSSSKLCASLTPMPWSSSTAGHEKHVLACRHGVDDLSLSVCQHKTQLLLFGSGRGVGVESLTSLDEGECIYNSAGKWAKRIC